MEWATYASTSRSMEKKTDSARVRQMKSELYKSYMENLSTDIIPLSKQLERFKTTLR